MKKYLKITVLLCLILCAIATLAIFIKDTYLEYMQTQIEISTENLINQIEEEGIVEEDIISQNGEIGFIIIPKLHLKAPIKEGTDAKILKYSVGHFTITELWKGNIALASHNRGSYAHYFSRINELENGEEIIYITNMGERRYEVVENKIIEETNVKVLENTDENIITLITCVTGQKDKRQCVIGKEIK